MSVLSDHLSKDTAPVGTGHPVLPRVNLLPPEIAERARAKKIKAGLGGGLLLVVGLVAALYASAAGSVHEATAELEVATATGTALRADKAEYADVEAVYARAAAAEAMLTQAMGEEVRYSQYLNDLSLTVPDNVWLTSVTFAQTPTVTAAVGAGTGEPAIGTVTFSGVAFSHDDVAVWLDSLAGQKGYQNPYFTDSTKGLIGKRETVAFTSTVELTSDALSGRFTAPAGG